MGPRLGTHKFWEILVKGSAVHLPSSHKALGPNPSTEGKLTSQTRGMYSRYQLSNIGTMIIIINNNVLHIFLCMLIILAYMHVFHPQDCCPQKSELELQILRAAMWLLETESGFSARAINALNHQSTVPALAMYYIFDNC